MQAFLSSLTPCLKNRLDVRPCLGVSSWHERWSIPRSFLPTRYSGANKEKTFLGQTLAPIKKIGQVLVIEDILSFKCCGFGGHQLRQDTRPANDSSHRMKDNIEIYGGMSGVCSGRRVCYPLQAPKNSLDLLKNFEYCRHYRLKS